MELGLLKFVAILSSSGQHAAASLSMVMGNDTTRKLATRETSLTAPNDMAVRRALD
jgi:hypothetical protein